MNVYNIRTDELLAEVAKAELAILIHQAEEESQEDQGYAITELTHQLLEAEGADHELISLLREALSGREEIEVRSSS